MDKSFIFGVATSSYQIEGGIDKDGAGVSNWTVFSNSRGNITNDDTGNIACNHYGMWDTDLEMMASLGIQSYRFSISWSRIFPDSSEKVNLKGILFYQRILQKLIELDIEPMITLYHWDLPQWLEDIGGWTNPDIIHHFNKYATTVYQHFNSLCSKWITLNEPWVFLHKGYITGEHAPGIADTDLAGKAYVNILKSHAAAVREMRAISDSSEIGIACNVSFISPSTSLTQDINAASRYSSYINNLFLDPWIKGKIPEIAFELFGPQLPENWLYSSDELITKHDFIGLNYYSKTTIMFDNTSFMGCKQTYSGLPVTSMDWEIYPQGLTWLLQWAYYNYKIPIYITENGAAFEDELNVGGHIHDGARIDYFKSHLEAVDIASNSGVDVRGYYAWSFLDNFEWEAGYEKRFGIIYVDFNTLQRTIKDSGYFYKDYIKRSQYSSANSIHNKNVLI
jgi:beta-glucosidase